jgi:peptidoglycan-binding domain 1 protein
MLSALQAKDWAEFAKRYNGPAYEQNQYDKKLAAAYQKFS